MVKISAKQNGKALTMHKDKNGIVFMSSPGEVTLEVCNDSATCLGAQFGLVQEVIGTKESKGIYLHLSDEDVTGCVGETRVIFSNLHYSFTQKSEKIEFFHEDGRMVSGNEGPIRCKIQSTAQKPQEITLQCYGASRVSLLAAPCKEKQNWKFDLLRLQIEIQCSLHQEEIEFTIDRIHLHDNGRCGGVTICFGPFECILRNLDGCEGE